MAGHKLADRAGGSIFEMGSNEKANPYDLPPKEKRNVGLFIDTDNLLISIANIPEFSKINPLRLLKTVVEYAELQGRLVLPYMFVTTRSDSLDILLNNTLQECGLSINIVPPFPNAADREIEKMVSEFALHRADLDSVVLVGRDAAAFRPLCEALTLAGKEVHVITPGTSSGGIMRIATHTRSILSLIKRSANRDQAFQREQRSPKYARKKANIPSAMTLDFTTATFKIARKERTGTTNEQFVFDCLEAVEHHLKKRSFLTFSFMLEKVWERISIRWSKSGFTRENHCKAALNTLIDADIIKRIEGEVIDNKNIPHYVLRGRKTN
ncbi:MAG: NYN domain-containing protein [Candidatus Niyogibacteria bacterium]|nr:NYN domain-containing protein [Candidatus Niyogibacteria bacterium]